MRQLLLIDQGGGGVGDERDAWSLGVAEGGCSPGSRRLAGRQALCRLMFAVAKEKSLMSFTVSAPIGCIESSDAPAWIGPWAAHCGRSEPVPASIGSAWVISPRRWAVVAASTRLFTSSLERM
jgi:hypothetical protein